MHTTALLLAVALAANPPAVTQKTERGFLSGLGITLLVVGAGGIAAGVAGVMNANETAALQAAYPFQPATEDLPNVRFLEERRAGNTALAVTGFVAGAAAIIGGIICLAVDSPRVNVAFAPGPNGGALVVSGRF